LETGGRHFTPSSAPAPDRRMNMRALRSETVRQKGLFHEMRRHGKAYLFVSPFFVLFIVFGLYPIIYSFVLSLNNWHSARVWEFVGLKNYATLLFKDPVFWISVYNNVYIFIINVPVMIFLSILIAIALNNPARRHKDLFRIVYLLPYVTSVLSIAIVFYVFFDDQSGLVNLLIGTIGIPAVHWLTSQEMSKVSIDILVTWKWTGYNMIIALAGLQSIDTQIYDAVKIDGASGVRTFWQITFPLLRPVIGFQFITAMIGTFNLFTEPYFLTNGGPGYSSLTLVLYLYRSAFKFFQLGYGAAIAFLTFIFVLIPSVAQVRIWAQRDRTYSAT
jgi:ABC-type sugar transport system permease subunit